MSGAFVCAALSIVPTVRHADYLASWLDVLREDNRAIIRAASAASKAADYLLAFRDGEPRRIRRTDRRLIAGAMTSSPIDPRRFYDFAGLSPSTPRASEAPDQARWAGTPGAHLVLPIDDVRPGAKTDGQVATARPRS